MLYIVFEGDNGVGKSTQLGRVKGKLDELFGRMKIKVRPQINIFHEGETCKEHYDNWYECVLDYARDRASLQHLIKSQSYSDITIADRSYYSSLVYQGKSDPILQGYIRAVNQFATEPDIIFLLTNNPESENYKHYLKVLPYGSTFPINTKAQINLTTNEIITFIVYNWLVEYLDYEHEEAFTMAQKHIEAMERK